MSGRTMVRHKDQEHLKLKDFTPESLEKSSEIKGISVKHLLLLTSKLQRT